MSSGSNDEGEPEYIIMDDLRNMKIDTSLFTVPEDSFRKKPFTLKIPDANEIAEMNKLLKKK